jgi:hypothetical protein
MTTFKVGDRVKVHGWVQMHNSPYVARRGGIATVKWIANTEESMHVVFDRDRTTGEEDDIHYSAHPKQCRKLVKRERRRIWIGMPALESLGNIGQVITLQIWQDKPKQPATIEFIEVRKKKES